jgi:nucleotide-binding universal stress UspA family protein
MPVAARHASVDPRVMDENSHPVVVAFDGSPESVEAARTAGALFPDRPILVVTVWEPGLAMAMTANTSAIDASYIPPSPEAIETVDRAQHDHASAMAEAGAQAASAAGGNATAYPVPDEVNVAETIAAIAEQRDAAALVVGSRGLGRMRSLLGSTSRRLMHDTHRPVLVVRLPD